MTTRSPRPGATVWPNTEGTASVAQTVSKAPDTNVRRHRLVEAPTANRTTTRTPASGTIDCRTATMPRSLSTHLTPTSDATTTTPVQSGTASVSHR